LSLLNEFAVTLPVSPTMRYCYPVQSNLRSPDLKSKQTENTQLPVAFV